MKTMIHVINKKKVRFLTGKYSNPRVLYCKVINQTSKKPILLFMEDSNYQWSTLFKKYRHKEINEEELKELERLINTCPVKMQQFKQWTDSHAFAQQVQQYTNINKEGAWERLVAAHPSVAIPPRLPFYKKVSFKLFFSEAFAVGFIIAAVILFFKPSFKETNNLTAALLHPVVKDHHYIKDDSGNEYRINAVQAETLFEWQGTKLLSYDTLLQIIAGQNPALHYTNNKLFDLVTAPGKLMNILFADSSTVKISAATVLRFPLSFSPKERRLQMNGQAYFTVATNKPAPFIVQLPNGVMVEAKGTSFNITNFENDSLVMTLITGKVKMTYNNLEIVVTEGQQIEFTKEKKFRLIKDPHIDEATAWTRHEFNFNNKDIKEVIQEIARFYHYKVIFKTPLPPMPSGGIFDMDKNNLQEILTAIERLHAIKIHPEGNTLIVSRTR